LIAKEERDETAACAGSGDFDPFSGSLSDFPQ
jgi:hypothetical protein